MIKAAATTQKHKTRKKRNRKKTIQKIAVVSWVTRPESERADSCVCGRDTQKERERTQRKAFIHSGGHKIRTDSLQVFCTCCCSCLLLLLLLLKQHVVFCCTVCHCCRLWRSRPQMGSLFVPALWAPLAATLHADGQEPFTHTTPLTHQG